MTKANLPRTLLARATLQRSAHAEHAGDNGDWREAARLYQEIGDDLKEVLGPHDRLTLDAYQNMTRWTEGGRR